MLKMKKIAADKNYRTLKRASGGIKVVYNDTYGGFSLSPQGKALYEQLSGNKFPGDYTVSRHDPVLVHVVETLGESANDGSIADLKIAIISGNQYRITEYDGLEGVQTPDSIEFITVDEQDFSFLDHESKYPEDSFFAQEGMGKRMPKKHKKNRF